MKKTKYDLLLAGVISESQYETSNKVPNMDAMTHDQLGGFVAMYRNPRPDEAVKLTGIAEPEMAMDVARLLAAYATNKQKSMESRASGDMGSAIRHEDDCDKLYERLPEDLRW